MEASEGNALIEKLKRQTEENREKNELLVQQKTFMNDKVSIFHQKQHTSQVKANRFSRNSRLALVHSTGRSLS